MANNSDPPTGWNTGNTLGQMFTRRNNEQKEATEEEEEVEVAGVKSVLDQIAEREKQQETIDLCSPFKALENNNDTTIIDNTTATDDDEMKRLLLVISELNPALKKKNKEIIIKVFENNNDTTIIANTKVIDDDGMKDLLLVISELSPALKKKNFYLEIQNTATKISKLKTVLKKMNKKIQDTNKKLEKAEAQAVAGIVIAVLLLVTCGGMWWHGKIQFSDGVTFVYTHRESCSE